VDQKDTGAKQRQGVPSQITPTGYPKPFVVLDKEEIIKGEVAWIKIQQNYRNGLRIIKMVIDGQV